MALQPEARFKTRVLADLRRLPNTYAVKIQQVCIRGTPDILACINGCFIAIELKKDDKEKPTVAQLHELRKIQKAGGMSIVACPSSWPDTLRYLKTLASKLITVV